MNLLTRTHCVQMLTERAQQLIRAATLAVMCAVLGYQALQLVRIPVLRREAVRSSCTTVFSHRGRGARNKGSLLSEGSLLLGVQRGVRAYDLDLVFTSDGSIFVAHPSEVRQSSADASAKPGVGRKKDAFDLGSAMRVTTLLEVASRMGDNLTLALDLKGAERGAGFVSALEWLHAEVVRRRLQRSVWLWVAARAHAHAKRLHEQDRSMRRVPVRFGKALYDTGAPRVGHGVDCSGQLNAEDVDVYGFIGPSAKCANAQLLTSSRAAAFFERPHGWLPWVIDDAHTLRSLHAAGVRAVISNLPAGLKAEVGAADAQFASTHRFCS